MSGPLIACRTPSAVACAYEPRTTPPSAATSSTIEVISKASRWSVRNALPIAAGLPNDSGDLRVREASARLQPERDDDLDQQRSGRRDRADRLPARPSRPGGVRAPSQVRDHEQEHDHHRARVDQHLRGGDELGREQQVEDGERAEVPDQRERRVERVRERDDRDARAEAGEGGEHPDGPDEEVRHLRLSPCTSGIGVS